MSRSKIFIDSPTYKKYLKAYNAKLVNFVPIFHSNIDASDSGDVHNAAKYAWNDLEKLAQTFCEAFCCRYIEEYKGHHHCLYNNEDDDTGYFSDRSNWENYKFLFHGQQHSLHESFSYLQEILGVGNDFETCPVCRIAMALAYFTILIRYSPVPPVSNVKVNVTSKYQDIVYMEVKHKISFPCCIITYQDLETEVVDKRVKERALLGLDLENLPAIPQLKYNEIKETLEKGQSVLRKLFDLAFPNYRGHYHIVGDILSSSSDRNFKRLAQIKQGKVIVDFVEEKNGWHWYVNEHDTGVWCKRVNSKKYKISHILFNQIGCGWIPHETFYQAVGWKKDVYFDRTGDKGRMQKELNKLRKRLGVKIKIEFRKEEGVKFADNIVKAPK